MEYIVVLRYDFATSITCPVISSLTSLGHLCSRAKPRQSLIGWPIKAPYLIQPAVTLTLFPASPKPPLNNIPRPCSPKALLLLLHPLSYLPSLLTTRELPTQITVHCCSSFYSALLPDLRSPSIHSFPLAFLTRSYRAIPTTNQLRLGLCAVDSSVRALIFAFGMHSTAFPFIAMISADKHAVCGPVPHV